MSEDQLNSVSSDFDPLLAIYNPDSEKTEEGVVYDNVEKCIAVIEGRVATVSKKKAQKDQTPEAEEPQVKLERQFLPDQMPVKGKRKDFRHVIARMGEFATGPMAKLKQWMENRTRVRVWTRGINNIRGVSTGFIVAFDKHWNLAIQDVDEQFTRKANRKIPATGDAKAKVPANPCGVGDEYKMGFSLVRVVERKGKSEICHRHVDQVLLRGEHVAMVACEEIQTKNLQEEREKQLQEEREKYTESRKVDGNNPVASTSVS